MSTPHVPWPRVERHANERIEALRSALEIAPPDKIAPLQAEIRAWRQVLALPVALDIAKPPSSTVPEY